MIDAQLPAICGAAQVIQRPGDVPLVHARGPIELMVEAARAAVADAGAPSLVEKVGWVGVAGGFWRYHNPGNLVAELLGARSASTALAAISGSAPQELVGLAAARIARGELDVALVVGGEARWTTQRLKRAGEEPTWMVDPGEGAPQVVSGYPDELLAEARVFGSAATAYALMDDSRRTELGETVDAHRAAIAGLWSRFSAVAATNPFAWEQNPRSAEEISEAGPQNRMISFPYTKAMVANNTVDMASALLLCSTEVALTAGVSRDRLVFPHAVTSSHETWQMIDRKRLHGAPALAAAGREALALADIGSDDLAHIDLYACFPAIVQMSSDALGLDPTRQLTVTGGLGFAGAPVGNAAGQSIAALVPLVRSGGYGFVHANGGNATKHAFGVYANQPPRNFAFRHVDNPDPVTRPGLEADYSGPVTVEAATVVFDRDGPSHVFAAVLTADGQRSWATTRDSGTVTQVMAAGLAGASAFRSSDGQLALTMVGR